MVAETEATVNETVAAKVAAIVRGNGQSQLARKLDVSPAHISLVLRGKRCASLQVAAGLAGELGITIDEWYGWWRGVGAGVVN